MNNVATNEGNELRISLDSNGEVVKSPKNSNYQDQTMEEYTNSYDVGINEMVPKLAPAQAKKAKPHILSTTTNKNFRQPHKSFSQKSLKSNQV